MYAVIVTSREVRANLTNSPIVTNEGDRFWVIDEPEGWVAATSCRYRAEADIPSDIKTFGSRQKAESFAKRWKGHPWWCSPKDFEIVKVIPKYKKLITEYKLEDGA